MEMSVIGQIWLHYAQACGKHVCTLASAHSFRARVCAYHIPPRAHAHGHSSGAAVGPLASAPGLGPPRWPWNVSGLLDPEPGDLYSLGWAPGRRGEASG